MSSPQVGSAPNPNDEFARLHEENERLRGANETLNQELRELENKYTRVFIEGTQKEQQARPMQLLRNAQDGIFFSNAKGEIVFINPYLGGILGLGDDEKKLIGKPLPPTVWEDQNELPTINEDLASYGQIRDRLVIMRNQRSGERVYISLSSVAVRDPYGKMIGAQHVLCNITSKMRITEELRVRNQFLSILTSLIAPRQAAADLNTLLAEILTKLLDALATPAQGAIYLKAEGDEQLTEVIRLYHNTEGNMSDSKLHEAATQAITDGHLIVHQQTLSEKDGSTLAAPLVAELDPIGVIVFEAASSRIYTETEQEMLNVVALGLAWTVKYFWLNSVAATQAS